VNSKEELKTSVDLTPALFSKDQNISSGLLLAGCNKLIIGFSTPKKMQEVGKKKVPIPRGGRAYRGRGAIPAGGGRGGPVQAI